MVNQEIVDEYLAMPEKLTICNKVQDGQVFEIENPYEMPNGICAGDSVARGFH